MRHTFYLVIIEVNETHILYIYIYIYKRKIIPTSPRASLPKFHLTALQDPASVILKSH